MLKKISLALAVLVLGFLGFAATRPDSYHVERSLTMNAPAAVIFDQLNSLEAWQAWSPWEGLDPQIKKTYEGPKAGVGASYSWQGNDKVGKGRIEITDAKPVSAIKYRLEFIEPFASVADTGFTLAESAGRTSVTWSMDGKNDFMAKAFGIFFDMDKVVGADFEKGLAALGGVAEAEDKRRAAAQAAPPADAEGAVTLTGTMVCGHCTLKETDSCQNVLKVKQGEEEVKYYLADNQIAQDNHGPVCAGSKPATVTGTVSEDGGKKLLTASSITYQ